MTILEVYCDRCDTPAPTHAMIGGLRDGQCVRQLLPEYQAHLRDKCGWVFTRGEDLCPECSLRESDSGEPVAGWAKIGDEIAARSSETCPEEIRVHRQVGPRPSARRVGSALGELYARTGEAQTVKDIASHLGKTTSYVYPRMNKLLRAHLIRCTGGWPQGFVPVNAGEQDRDGDRAPATETEFVVVDW